MNENKNQLRENAIELAIQISDLCDEIKGCSVYVNQIVRSSSSIGANIHEAKYAQSKADFINKLEISLKECSETEYWLELIFRKGKMDETTYKDLRNKCGSIRRRLIASITTAKENALGQMMILSETRNLNLHQFSITYRRRKELLCTIFKADGSLKTMF